MFYSYNRSKHQKYTLLDIHQINALSSCCYLSKVLLKKKHVAMQKLFMKKGELKNEQVSKILKTMGT
jgi:hypothetical protein